MEDCFVDVAPLDDDSLADPTRIVEVTTLIPCVPGLFQGSGSEQAAALVGEPVVVVNGVALQSVTTLVVVLQLVLTVDEPLTL